jgi:hypothetical protein
MIRRVLVPVNIFIVILAAYLMVSGVSDFNDQVNVMLTYQTYGSVEGIIDSYAEDGGSSPWTCADNSNSV